MRPAIAALGLLLSTSLASAADLGGPIYGGSMKDDFVAPIPSWTGLYFGGHVGYGWGEWDGETQGTGAPQPTNGGFSDPHRTLDADGWLGGGQLGFNWQAGKVVFGIEADISAGDMGERKFIGITDDDGIAHDFAKELDFTLKYFGSVRGRIGYAMGQFMPYITGGFAWAKTEGDISSTQLDPPGVHNNPANATGYLEDGTSRASVSETHTGWVVGVGTEIMLAQNLTARAEWLHFDLGKEDYSFKGTTFTGAVYDHDQFPADLTFDVFRLGVNYKFNH